MPFVFVNNNWYFAQNPHALQEKIFRNFYGINSEEVKISQVF